MLNLEDFKAPPRYRMLRRLGSGGMGVVYATYDAERSQAVALKTLRQTNPSAIHRFKREFRTLADVAHRNLVSLYDLVVDDRYCFFTMEWIDGPHFLDHVRSPERLRPALVQLVEGVQILHDAGIVHRDLKPSNVLVDAEGRVVILDFGLALDSDLSTVESDGRLSGTVPYMSPEQASGVRGGEASDWYSVGVMLYQALTGNLPHTGTIYQVLVAKKSKDPIYPSAVHERDRDLFRICQGLLNRDPSRRMRANEVLSILGRPVNLRRQHQVKNSPPLIGRETEFDLLVSAFQHNQGRNAVSLIVYGPSGMGKTTLVSHFLGWCAAESRALVLSGRCYERESVPHKALDGVMDSLMRYLARLPDRDLEPLIPGDVAGLTRSFPILLEIPALRRAAELEGEEDDPILMRRQAFGALRDLLARIASKRPIIIHVDDLHWCDADGAMILTDLLKPPDAPPVLIVATFRSEEAETKPFLRDLINGIDNQCARGVFVASLADEPAQHLAMSFFGRDTPTTTISTIVREAGGSPFFIEQLVQYAMEHEAGATTGITLGEMLEARLSRMPAGAQAMMNVLAVAGHPMDTQAAYEAAGYSGDERPLIANLRTGSLIRSAGGSGLVEVYHDRIRKTLTVSLDAPGIREIHSRIAQALVKRGFDDPETLFEHYMGVNDWQNAGTQSAIAASRSAAALAFERAAAFYRYALDLGSNSTDERLRLTIALADVLANAGRTSESADTYLIAATVASSTAALEFRRKAAEQYLTGGHVDQGLDVIDTVLSAAGLKFIHSRKLALLSLLARRAQLLFRGIRFVERQNPVIRDDRLLRMETCWVVGIGLSVIDSIRAADFHTRHTLMALSAGEPNRIARSLAIEAAFAATAGVRSRRRASDLMRASDALAAKLGDAHAMGLVILAKGASAYFMGQWKRAFELGEQGEQALRRYSKGTTWELSSAQNFVLGSLMYLGELREVCQRVPSLIEAAQERSNLYVEIHLRTRQNLIHLVVDQPDRALADIEHAMNQWSHRGYHVQHYNSLLARAQIALYRGQGAEAWRLVNNGWAALRASLLLRVQVVRIEATYLRARCGLAAGQPGMEVLADKLYRERAGWAFPLANVVRAACDRKRRVALLTSAAEDFARAGMMLHAAASQYALAGDGGHGMNHAQAQAEEWMKSQGVVNPDRMARMVVVPNRF